MKIYTYTLTIFLFFGSIAAFSQPGKYYPTNPDKNRANIWYFGQFAGLNFNAEPPTALTDGKVNTIRSLSGGICRDYKSIY